MDSKTAAIAITLIVAIPIILGYAMSFEEVEREGYETGSATNITGEILNNQTPYFNPSTSPGNNAELFARYYYMGSGAWDNRLIAPHYTVVGPTYTSLPTYSSASGTFTVNGEVTTTGSGQPITAYANGITYGHGIPSGHAYYAFTSTNLSTLDNGSGSQQDLGTTWRPFMQDESGSWTGYRAGGSPSTFDIDTDMRLYSDILTGLSFTVKSRPWTVVDLTSDYSMSIGICAVKLTDSFGNVTYYQSRDSPTYMNKNGPNVIIGSDSFSDITEVAIAPTTTLAGTNDLQYTYLSPDGNYAMPSEGWTTVTPGANEAIYQYWQNGQSNQSVRMMIHIQTSEWTDLNIYDNTTLAETLQIRNNGTTTTVNSINVGTYDYLCLDIGIDSVKISGITAWPTMGVSPALMNSITIEYTTPIDFITRIQLTDDHSVDYRVDGAQILAGYFASTLNKTLDMPALYPNSNYAFSLTSIGIYGSSITYAGETFTVDGTTITIGDVKVKLLRAVFSSIYDDSQSKWINTINGHEIGDGSAPATITFNDEWSLTVSAYTINNVTGSYMEWQAGEFAFNGVDSDFALMGLLGCLAVFVGLGLYGRRTGAKVWSLMLICGCSAAVFLILL